MSAQAGEPKDPLSEFLSEARSLAVSSTPPVPSGQEAGQPTPEPAAEVLTYQWVLCFYTVVGYYDTLRLPNC